MQSRNFQISIITSFVIINIFEGVVLVLLLVSAQYNNDNKTNKKSKFFKAVIFKRNYKKRADNFVCSVKYYGFLGGFCPLFPPVALPVSVIIRLSGDFGLRSWVFTCCGILHLNLEMLIPKA